MKKADFTLAIEIIAEHHTSEITINKVKPNGQVSPVLESPTIQVHRCCASVINKLIAYGFTVSMNEGALSIDKY